MHQIENIYYKFTYSPTIQRFVWLNYSYSQFKKKRFLLFDIIYLCLSSGGFNRGRYPCLPPRTKFPFHWFFQIFFSNTFRFIFVMYVVGVPPPRNPTSAPTNFFLSTKTFKKSLLKSY